MTTTRPRFILCAAFTFAALFVSEAQSLPAGMTLPATYSVHGPVVTTLTMTVRGQTRTVTQQSRGRDTLTVQADGTFSIDGFVGDGSPATGTWTEFEPNRFSRAYDADVEPRMDAMLTGVLHSFPGLRNAEVSCSLDPRTARVKRDGDRIVGSDRMRFTIRGNRVRGRGSMTISWSGRRIG